MEQKKTTEQARRRGRWKLFLVLLVCASPLLGSYFAYYVVKPQSRTNYGTLIDPRAYPIPPLASTALDGKPAGLEDYRGKWIMLKVGAGECLEACRKQLFAMRQLRTMQGKERERIERVWLVTDATPLDTVLMREYDGTRLLRANAAAVAKWLPVEPGSSADDHLYMIDPLGNLMMRFPKDPEPRKVHKDLYRLLKASAIG